MKQSKQDGVQGNQMKRELIQTHEITHQIPQNL